MLLRLKVWIAKAVGRLSRLTGRGGGTSLPGKVLLKLDANATGKLASELSSGSAIISATNGKTTTAALTRSVLQHAEISVVANSAGANMLGGVTTALLDAKQDPVNSESLGLFEVDEFWLDQVLSQVEARSLLLANLFRDQLDRYGELESIADRWKTVVAELPRSSTVVLNADDPLVADLGSDREGAIYFGVQDNSVGIPALEHASDSTNCRKCGSAYIYTTVFLGHLGHYHCPNCDSSRPRPTVTANKIDLKGIAGTDFELDVAGQQTPLHLPLPGLYNVYNAIAAAALCHSLEIDFPTIVAGLESAHPAFGRAELISIADQQLSLMLVKNPAGANEVIRTLELEPQPLNLFVILNDRIADGRDISWIWDADFEKIAAGIGNLVCSGTRAEELALRFKYAGVAPSSIQIECGLDKALTMALDKSKANTLFTLPTYTALLELKQLLTSQGHAPNYWENAE